MYRLNNLNFYSDTELVNIKNKISEILWDRRNNLRLMYHDKLLSLIEEMYADGFEICHKDNYFYLKKTDFEIADVRDED